MTKTSFADSAALMSPRTVKYIEALAPGKATTLIMTNGLEGSERKRPRRHTA